LKAIGYKKIYEGNFTLNHLFQLKDKNILLLMDFHQVKDFCEIKNELYGLEFEEIYFKFLVI
jgi:hypothetical protein